MKLIHLTIDVTRNTSPSVSDQLTFTKLRSIRTLLSTARILLIVDCVESITRAIMEISRVTTTNKSRCISRSLVQPIKCIKQAKIARTIIQL